jgi:hypothetical protein
MRQNKEDFRIVYVKAFNRRKPSYLFLPMKCRKSGPHNHKDKELSHATCTLCPLLYVH